MKLTRFRRLRNAAANLDMHFVAERILEVRKLLDGEGLPLNPADLAITEEGIYYIHPKSGMATKVALYMANLEVDFKDLPVRPVGPEGYDDDEMIREFSSYHLVRCNLLSQIKRDKWKGDYRILQAADGTFPFRIHGKISGEEVYQEMLNQRLQVCSNCITKINSLIGKGSEFTPESFEVSAFFDAGFEATWKKNYSRDRGVFADMYPQDWDRVSRRRKKQAQYICEQCNDDFSEPEDRAKLRVHHADHLSNKISYTRLRCVCRNCRDDLPGIKAPPKKKRPPTDETPSILLFDDD